MTDLLNVASAPVPSNQVAIEANTNEAHTRPSTRKENFNERDRKGAKLWKDHRSQRSLNCHKQHSKYQKSFNFNVDTVIEILKIRQAGSDTKEPIKTTMLLVSSNTSRDMHCCLIFSSF